MSTSIEDAFFLVKKCCLRSIAVGEWSVVKDVIETSRNTLNVEMIPFLQKRLRQLVPDPKNGDFIIVTLLDGGIIKLLSLQSMMQQLEGTFLKGWLMRSEM